MSTATKTRTQSSTQKVVFCGLFSAIAFVLYLIEFPILPAAPHLKLDFSDVPALISAIFFGPVFGIIVELIKNVLEFLVRGMGTQLGLGNLMNFLVGCAYIVPFGLLFNKFTNHRPKTKENKSSFKIKEKESMAPVKAIIIASIISIICMIIMGIATNYVITPIFFKLFSNTDIPKQVLWSYIGWATVMNVIKGGIISAIIYPFIKLFSKIKIN